MTTVSTRTTQHYTIRREVSQPSDLAILLLEYLVYTPPKRQPGVVGELVKRISEGNLKNLDNQRKDTTFRDWLQTYLTVLRTVKGTSFYPIHPALTLVSNGEGTRVVLFMQALAHCFTVAERESLVNALWSIDHLPAFESMLYQLIAHQLPTDKSSVAPPANNAFFSGCEDQTANPLSPTGIFVRTKEDLLLLAQATTGIQNFVVHAGRLLAFALSRYLLAKAQIDFSLPIYAAPAADSHEGVKTLAHEIIENHRSLLAVSMRERFREDVRLAMQEKGYQNDPATEEEAQQLARSIFDPRSNIVPKGQYANLLRDHGSFVALADHYYWESSGSTSRFLRQLHTTHLNMAKKAGFALSRSHYSQWHFYWLAPSLVETLLLVTQARLQEHRILLTKLQTEWRDRYGIAMQIDSTWDDVYRQYFRGFGNPEALNEVNERRFCEMLAERNRLHKNSDDFPWVILKD